LAKIRIWIQILFTALTNSYVQGIYKVDIYKGKFKSLCVPGLNCYSCPGALGSCPIGALQSVIGDRKFNLSFYMMGFFLIIGGFIGRFVCGWLCPFGLVQDLIYKIPFVKKINKFSWDKYLRWLKYIILLMFVIILPMFVVNFIGMGSPWFCKYICPSGTLTAGIPIVMGHSHFAEAAGFLFKWKLAILIISLFLSIIIYRPFCKYICPLGAIYGFFNPIALFRFRIDETKCISCKKCERTCKFNIKVYEQPNSFECIRCGDCKDVCPTKAIVMNKIKKS